MTRANNAGNIATYVLVLAVLGVPILVLISPTFEEEESVALAMRLSAKLAFFVYVPIFMARPLRELLSNSFTLSLLRNRPYLGLSFAAIMTVHLALIGWWFIFVTGERLPAINLLVGGTAYALVFLMAITTFEAPARAMGSKYWRRLHKTGLFFVGGVFLNALVPSVIAMPSDPVYLAAGILIVLAITVRVMAFVKRKTQKTAAIESAR